MVINIRKNFRVRRKFFRFLNPPSGDLNPPSGEIRSKTPKILLAHFLLIAGVGRLAEDANSPQSRYEEQKTINSEVSL
jgi:hypothetical protein